VPCMAGAQPRPKLDPSSPVPLYLQAADHIGRQVESGNLAPGTKLDSERDLADAWQIAYGTVRRMMQELRERGLIVTTQGKGTFVRK
jgi:GntR family transcriptional regulator